LLVGLHFITMFVIALSLIVSTTLSNDDLMFYMQHAYLPQELLINLGSLLSNYAARFEPFLIALFVWWRMQRNEEEETIAEEVEKKKSEFHYPEL